jgi:hypothetical protein
VGTEKEQGSDWVSTASFEVELATRVTRNGYIRAGYIHSGSRLAAADGFRARGFFLAFDLSIPR